MHLATDKRPTQPRRNEHGVRPNASLKSRLSIHASESVMRTSSYWMVDVQIRPAQWAGFRQLEPLLQAILVVVVRAGRAHDRLVGRELFHAATTLCGRRILSPLWNFSVGAESVWSERHLTHVLNRTVARRIRALDP